jgi:hypothetical protein
VVSLYQLNAQFNIFQYLVKNLWIKAYLHDVSNFNFRETKVNDLAKSSKKVGFLVPPVNAKHSLNIATIHEHGTSMFNFLPSFLDKA